MPDKYALTGEWSDDNDWSLTSGGAGGAGTPQASERAFLDVNSGDFALDEHSASGIGDFDMTGYTGTFTLQSYILNVDGDVTLDGALAQEGSPIIRVSGNFTKTSGMTALPADLYILLDGTGTVTCNGVLGGGLMPFTAGTLTFADAQYWSSYTFVSGTVDHDSRTLTVAGPIVSPNIGTQNNIGIVHQTVSATLNWQKSTDAMGEFHNDVGNTTTLTDGWTYVVKVTDGLAGAIADDGGSRYFGVRMAGVDNFWRPAASATFTDVLVGWLYADGLTPGGEVYIPNADRLHIWGNDETLTFDGKVECAKFYLQPTQALKFAKVITDGYPFLIHNGAWIGKTSATNATGGGVIDARGSYMKVEGTLQKGHANNTMNQILMPDILDMSGGGSLNGTLIDVDAVEDNCHIIGGTCSWVEADNDVHCHGTTDGGANDKLTFDEYVQPGSLAACGAGI